MVSEWTSACYYVRILILGRADALGARRAVARVHALDT